MPKWWFTTVWAHFCCLLSLSQPSLSLLLLSLQYICYKISVSIFLLKNKKKLGKNLNNNLEKISYFYPTYPWWQVGVWWVGVGVWWVGVGVGPEVLLCPMVWILPQSLNFIFLILFSCAVPLEIYGTILLSTYVCIYNFTKEYKM